MRLSGLHIGYFCAVSAVQLGSIALAEGAGSDEWFIKPIRGRSTYYGNYGGGGACGLDQPDGSAIPAEIQGIDFTVALDQPQFDVGGCGMCILLNGTGVGAGGNPVNGIYTAFVNNLCPECEYGHLDFALPGDGSWEIEWKAIPCDVRDHKIRFVFMGSNDFYLKVSTQASRFPTKALRLKMGGEWREGWPVHGSYFEFRDGAPFTFPMEVEITSVFGEVLTDWIESLQGGPSTIQYTLQAEELTSEMTRGATWEGESGLDDDLEGSSTTPDENLMTKERIGEGLVPRKLKESRRDVGGEPTRRGAREANESDASNKQSTSQIGTANLVSSQSRLRGIKASNEHQ
ncbi:Barwin-related endoglucanase [Nannochloropsis gaditana]|uniref:Barwin-related endoglucanase n=1 Tax=Nannochloropsis gaditana TaxID=72520 RepID=W7TX31_9STRA|nr:Barwin-related endoglucanase [Nannochloropsis gaditana]